MIKILALFWTVLTLLVFAFGKPGPAPYDPADYAAGQPQSVTEGSLRVELLRDSLVRLETKGPRGFENRPSFTVEKRTGWNDVAFTEKSENGYRLIETAHSKRRNRFNENFIRTKVIFTMIYI